MDSELTPILNGLRQDAIELVAQTYLTHERGETVNPDSYFLRFPEQPANRIIALPAAIVDSEGDQSVSGIKWIASYPDNIKSGIPRASAVLILNDPPYGTERSYNALRLARALLDKGAGQVRVFLMGEDVGRYGGTYAVSKGLLEEFGAHRVRDTPLSESGFVGCGIGAAINGLRPIVEVMTVNFSLLALDQIVNNAATLRHMSGGQVGVPVVLRMTSGAGRQLAGVDRHRVHRLVPPDLLPPELLPGARPPEQVTVMPVPEAPLHLDHRAA